MRTKKRFIFDEEKEAERIIAEGFPKGKIDYGDMYLVSKYFREKENLGELRLEKRLIEFCKMYDGNFNPVKNKTELGKWITSALNYNLRKVTSILISEKDVEFLKTIENNRDRKLLFMTLVFSKAIKEGNTRRKETSYEKSDNYYLRYGNFKDIVRMAELNNISEAKFARILYNYKDLFMFYNPEKELIKLEFVDLEMAKEIVIDNLDNPMLSYQEIFGKNMTYCLICGEEIHKKSNRQLSCDNVECRNELNRKRVENFRKKE